MTKISGIAAPLSMVLVAALAACGADVTNHGVDKSNVAHRVVTLAPHLAELMFAAKAGDKLIGVSAYTDYPAEATTLPLIGDAFGVDLEQLAILKPDLLLAWDSGTPAHVVDQLRDAGYRVEVIRTRGLDDVATALMTIGELTGELRAAQEAALVYRDQIKALAGRFSDVEPILVFYQVSKRPLYTVNGTHFISELIELCGGQNVFADIGDLAPMIDVEAVIDRNPEAMLTGKDGGLEAFDVWNRWPGIAANRYSNRFFMPAAEIGRATPRLADAGRVMCKALDQARTNRREYQIASRSTPQSND